MSREDDSLRFYFKRKKRWSQSLPLLGRDIPGKTDGFRTLLFWPFRLLFAAVPKQSFSQQKAERVSVALTAHPLWTAVMAKWGSAAFLGGGGVKG